MQPKFKRASVQEIISLHCGQAGVQVGNAFWEMACAEHFIQANGKISDDYEDARTAIELETFFHPLPSGQYCPRTFFMDLEPTVIDEVRSGFYRGLFNPDCLINGKHDAANNFARGYYCHGRKILAEILQQTRHAVERCNNFQGFITYAGQGGGTGSGLLTLLVDKLSIEYAGKSIIQLSLQPGDTLNNTIVEPYNTLMATQMSIDPTDVNLLADNQSLYAICEEKLGICRPTYTNINRLLSPIISGITAPLRFRGYLTGGLHEISVNLIPYPRIHFPMISFAPLSTESCHNHNTGSTSEITRAVFDDGNHTLQCSFKTGKFMSCVLMYRGDTCCTDVQGAIHDVKRIQDIPWVDWCPTGFKVSHVSQPPLFVGHSTGIIERSLLMLSNHSCIGQPIEGMMNRFSKLFEKRAYVHWYVSEGMEEFEFTDALEDTKVLVEDYKEVVKTIDEMGKDENKKSFKAGGLQRQTDRTIAQRCLQFEIDRIPGAYRPEKFVPKPRAKTPMFNDAGAAVKSTEPTKDKQQKTQSPKMKPTEQELDVKSDDDKIQSESKGSIDQDNDDEDNKELIATVSQSSKSKTASASQSKEKSDAGSGAKDSELASQRSSKRGSSSIGKGFQKVVDVIKKLSKSGSVSRQNSGHTSQHSSKLESEPVSLGHAQSAEQEEISKRASEENSKVSDAVSNRVSERSLATISSKPQSVRSSRQHSGAGEMSQPPIEEEPKEESAPVSVKESPAVSVRESPGISPKESPAVSVKESPAVSVKESPAVSVKESPAASIKESPARSERGSLPRSENSTPKLSPHESPRDSQKASVREGSQISQNKRSNQNSANDELRTSLVESEHKEKDASDRGSIVADLSANVGREDTGSNMSNDSKGFRKVKRDSSEIEQESSV